MNILELIGRSEPLFAVDIERNEVGSVRARRSRSVSKYLVD